MPTIEQLDAITLDDLEATGSTKWAKRDGSIGAFIAEMDFGIAEEITARLHREVDRGAFGYLPADLRTEMKQATAGFLQRRAGWDVDPAHIHEMPDVIAAYQAAIESFLRPDSKIIVPTPSYMPFLLVPPMLGREVIEVPMLVDEVTGDHRYDLDALEAAFEAGGELLVLCNPHNPTGRVFTREEMEPLVDLVSGQGGRVFSDEIWMPLTLEGEHIPYAALNETAASHTVTAVAASKAFNIPGLKCAQLITSNEADRQRWEEEGWLMMHGSANLGLAATSTAYQEAEPWLDDVRAYLRRNRDRLTELVSELLPKARLTSMQGTYIAWIDLREYGIEGSVRDFLREHARVECTDGTSCGKDWGGCVRFVYAMPQSLMVEAITRIAAAVTRARVPA